MAVINVLNPLVADMIAAGEVVERPGSVIKELMENSIDAGAHNITVEIRGGGMTYIRISDDGCGMAPDDAGNCFLRHATSKLRDERGLEAIATLGFRGEALAAISAVSRIELVTKKKDCPEGTRVLVEGGEIAEAGACGCPEGTTFVVKDLFYNTPARLKFMKSDRTEGAYCVQLALKIALGHPEISVRCIHDGKEDFFTAGDGQIRSAVYALLGRDVAVNMLECTGETEEVSIKGYISAPRAVRGNRSQQFFFVNGRAIKSQTLQVALEQAYKNNLLVGRFPACTLYLTIKPGLVDVNVHPTKSEIKFSHESQVFDAVYHAVKNAIENEGCTADIPISPATERKIQRINIPTAPVASTYSERTVSARKADSFAGTASNEKTEEFSGKKWSRESEIPPIFSGNVTGKMSPFSQYVPQVTKGKEEVIEFGTEIKNEEIVHHQVKHWTVVGEVMNTYIVVDMQDQMLLIDKHAAHERINFNRLKANQQPTMAQILLESIVWHAGAENCEIAAKHENQLKNLGFELEMYGEADMVIRAVPEDVDAADAISALEEICENLSHGGIDLARDKILQTIACKAAIKAGKSSDIRELEELAKRVVSGEIRYCPHGRPVAIWIDKNELDKRFKRIV